MGAGHLDGVVRDRRLSTVDFFFFFGPCPDIFGPCPDGQVSTINPPRRPFKAHEPQTTWLSATGNRQIRAELEPGSGGAFVKKR